MISEGTFHLKITGTLSWIIAQYYNIIINKHPNIINTQMSSSAWKFLNRIDRIQYLGKTKQNKTWHFLQTLFLPIYPRLQNNRVLILIEKLSIVMELYLQQIMESILHFQPEKNATGLGSTEQNKNDFFRGLSLTCQTIKNHISHIGEKIHLFQ